MIDLSRYASDPAFAATWIVIDFVICRGVMSHVSRQIGQQERGSTSTSIKSGSRARAGVVRVRRCRVLGLQRPGVQR